MTSRCRSHLAIRTAWALAILAVVGAAALTAGHVGAAPLKSGGLLHTNDIFLLPENWRSDDGSFNQPAIVDQQKKRLDFLNKELKIQFKMSETPHFLIMSAAGEPISGQFKQWAEALYASLERQVGLAKTEKTWDGKCLLHIFATDAEFKNFTKVVDGQNLGTASAYFYWERRGTKDGNLTHSPQLMHICIPTENCTPLHIQRRFTHETTHAFFALFYKPVDLPTWLNEGLAEYMTVVNDPTLRPEKLYVAKQYAASNKPLKQMLDDKTADINAEQYCVAELIVECLLTEGGPKLKQLVMQLKDGKSSDEALRSVYGQDKVSLEKSWRAYMAKMSMPPPPTKPK